MYDQWLYKWFNCSIKNMYLIKTPGWLKRIYNNCIWEINTKEKIVYLSFDDGPHPIATPFVLNELRKYNAKATFFCIGKNVKANSEIYKSIITEGHAVGNHTQNHLNGWKTNDKVYLDDIAEAKKYIDSNLFRPPYGRISMFQLRQLKGAKYNLKPVMWSVLSGDFDIDITPAQCAENVLLNSKSGSIVVFHDSEKAFNNLRYALPKVLEYFSKEGYKFEKIML